VDGQKQSWDTCKYSARGLVGCCSEYFSCLNKEIAELDAYPKLNLEKEDGSGVVSSTLFNHSHITHGGTELNLEWPETVFLQAEIDRSLVGCKHCRFYEPRAGEQTKFGKLEKVKKGNEEYNIRKLKIIES
jgi:hypothetical protein